MKDMDFLKVEGKDSSVDMYRQKPDGSGYI